MSKKPWENNYNRRLVRKQPRKDSFCIFTEGETEALYFNAFHLSSARIRCIGLGGGNAPYLAKEAVCKKKTEQYRNFDKYYLVFDCDANSADEIREVIQIAKKHRMEWIFSNPCFELWFLLHYALHETETDAHSLKGRLLCQHIDQYHETMPGIYERLLELQPNAFRNAQKLLENWENWQNRLHQANPSTNVSELVEHMNRFL